jgi:hypothetical protein
MGQEISYELIHKKMLELIILWAAFSLIGYIVLAITYSCISGIYNSIMETIRDDLAAYERKKRKESNQHKTA